MLSIYLTEELERHTRHMDNTEIVFFFCSAQEEKHNTAVAVLCGLVHQIVVKRPQLVKHALPYFKTPETTEQTLSSLETLWIIFSRLIADNELGTIFCVLDGLDECSEDTLRALVPRIVDLFSPQSSSQDILRSTTFRLAIVSRELRGLHRSPRIKLDPDNNKKVTSDIMRFIENKVDELSTIEGFNHDFGVSIRKALLEGAEGTFLWVGFVVRELLQQPSCTEIWAAIQKIPSGLPAIYSRMLDQIPANQEKTSSAILRWVTLALRPLTLLELAVAVGIESSHSLINLEQATSDAIRWCEPFVKIQNEVVSLVHQSARDYLLHGASNTVAPPGAFCIDSQRDHSQLMQTCLECVAQSSLKDGPLALESESKEVDLQESALLIYAVFYWPEHLKGCSTVDNGLYYALKHFLEDSSILRRHWWAAYRKEACRYLPEVLPLLHMLCYLGYEPLVQRTLTWDRWRPRFLKRVDSRDGDGRTALHLAAYERKEAIVRLLVGNGANTEARDKIGQTALHSAADEGNEVMIRLLVDNGADIEARNKIGQTALHIAAYQKKEAIVRLLLDEGADIKARSIGGQTALHSVIDTGEGEAIVRLLLDKGADIEARNTRGETALCFALGALRTEEAIVSLLVDKGADIEACGGKNEETPLHLASGKGNEGIVRLLLDKGADIEARNTRGETALYLAVRAEKEAMVSLLVDKGADVNVKGYNGYTAVHWAIMRKLKDASRLLIDKGADVNASSNSGWTVLREAIGRGDKELVQLIRDRQRLGEGTTR
jgi:ankyrin repeat protein